MSWQLPAALVAGYLLGSIPTAYLLGRFARGIDIREHGSGNVGSTNALRVLGRKLGIFCLVVDLLKGWGAVLLAAALLAPTSGAAAAGAGAPAAATTFDVAPWGVAGAGLAAILGHIYTIWLGFRGGKGVASTIGVFLGLAPGAMLAAVAIGVAVIWATRFVALGSLVIAWLIPAFMVAFALLRDLPLPWPPLSLALLLAATITVSHRGNIARLLAGTERRLGDPARPVAEETGREPR